MGRPIVGVGICEMCACEFPLKYRGTRYCGNKCGNTARNRRQRGPLKPKSSLGRLQAFPLGAEGDAGAVGLCAAVLRDLGHSLRDGAVPLGDRYAQVERFMEGPWPEIIGLASGIDGPELREALYAAISS